MAICVFAGLTAMMLLLCTQWRQMQRPLLPLLAVFVLVLAGNVAVQHTKDYLGVSSLTQETVNQTLDKTNKQSSQGGSEFKAVRVDNPVKFPYAFATVFWRPFPYEVKKAQQMIAAAEGMVLLGLTLLSWRSIASIPRRLRASPYLGYAILFVIVFVYAFSAFSNFGLLARERTQVLPLYLVLLALPVLPRKAEATPPPPNGQFAARWARNA
jgi:hypothetical protein